MISAIPAFTAYGIELEYMIVDRQTLSILPVADKFLRRVTGEYTNEVERGKLAWSNEIVLHLLELKNTRPAPALESLPAAFQSEVDAINRLLAPLDARLMPTAMHPWMKPRAETRLWPHDHALIYRTYDRIFDCKAHGWANLQSMHLNLPFAGDAEFARLHAAIRLVLPVIPALAASSPIVDGKASCYQDYRMEAYRTHQAKIPSSIARVIPDTVNSRAEYEATILSPMYQEIAAFDPDGVLRHEWLNVRGAVPRFERNAIEIRVIDLQECPQADIAIAGAVTAVVRKLYGAECPPLSMQQSMGTDALEHVLHACIRDAELAVIDDPDYLRLLGYPEKQCQAGELWCHLIETTNLSECWREPMKVILERGPLARRILRAVGPEFSKTRLHEVYGNLCECLATGQMFTD